MTTQKESPGRIVLAEEDAPPARIKVKIACLPTKSVVHSTSRMPPPHVLTI